MKKFYFTFGTSERMPYVGGWVEVMAHSQEEAVDKFVERYSISDNDLFNFAFFYESETFQQTEMYRNNSNLGYGCHEIIR